MNWYWIIILMFNSFIFNMIHLRIILVWLFLIFLNWNFWYLKIIHSLIQLVLLYQVYSDWWWINESIFLIYLHSFLIIIHLRKYYLFKFKVSSNISYYIQMFLSSMESILIMEIHSLDYILVIFNMMKVFHFIQLFISIYQFS